MQFTHYDLGQKTGGEIVEVTLNGSAANVRLLDDSNFHSYQAGRNHRYYGGHATRSPVRLQIPNSGRWHVVIDLGGYAGTIRSSIRVLPGPLPPLREVPLSSIPTLIQRESQSVPGSDNKQQKQYDVFISHAFEDKQTVVDPLVHALQLAGLKVWYDSLELHIGDSLRRKIDEGLAGSRFGIVVLSQAFFKKGWTNFELDGLVTRAVTGEQILLPIWHNVSKQEVMQYSSALADKVARSTSMHTVEEIAEEIASVIRRDAIHQRGSDE
jgi:hypothetical protein